MIKSTDLDLKSIDQKYNLQGARKTGRKTEIIFEKGQGLFLTDTNGNKYIDFQSGAVNANLGHCHPRLVAAATAQIQELSYAPTYGKASHKPLVRLIEKMKTLTPQSLDYFYFCSGGSEANDIAVQAARLFQKAKKKNKSKIVSLTNAYHGLTLGTVNLTDRSNPYDEPIKVNFDYYKKMNNYDCSNCNLNLNFPSCSTACIYEDKDWKDVAAVIIEPLQGAGFISPPTDYFKKLERVCRENDTLLIVDEVMTGFGRTGSFFATEHLGIRPDIITFGKALTSGHFPLSGMALSEEVSQAIQSLGYGFPVGYTYSGHPVGCAIALETIKVIETEGLLSQVQSTSHFFEQKLQEYFKDHPLVKNIGGFGLMRSLQLSSDKIVSQLFSNLREHKILIRISPKNRIGLAPPIIVNSPEIDYVLTTIKELLSALHD